MTQEKVIYCYYRLFCSCDTFELRIYGNENFGALLGQWILVGELRIMIKCD